MRRTGPYGRENLTLMRAFQDWLKERGLFDEETVLLAVPLDDPAAAAAEACRYDVCLPDPLEEIPAAGAVQRRRLNGGKYVVFLIEHTPEAVQLAWSSCLAQLARDGYSLDASRPIMERYAGRLIKRHRCELCVPIL